MLGDGDDVFSRLFLASLFRMLNECRMGGRDILDDERDHGG